MNENAEEKNVENKRNAIKAWHIVTAAVVLIVGIFIAVSGVSAGFVLIIIDILCAFHILFPAAMAERYLKSLVRSNNAIANIVRISAIIIAVFVDIFFLI